MTPQELAAELGQIGEELSDPQSILTELGSEITESMKRNVPVDTGALKQSIRYVVNGNTIEFVMLEYGFFQNYGVGGSASYNTSSYHKQFGNEFGVVTQPSSITFGIGRVLEHRSFGLPSQTFFDYDNILNTITDGIASFTEDF